MAMPLADLHIDEPIDDHIDADTKLMIIESIDSIFSFVRRLYVNHFINMMEARLLATLLGHIRRKFE